MYSTRRKAKVLWLVTNFSIRTCDSPLLREQCTAQRSGKHQAARRDATPMKRAAQNSLYPSHNEVNISKVFHLRAYQVDYL